MSQKRVCVVGAGAAGLCAARHLSAPGSGASATVFEQTDCVGGTWVYREATGQDPDTGLPIHSSMYKTLRTNLPKEVMGFPDFPIPEQEKSYLPSADILDFLNLYADHFNLRQYIKFRHHVKRIEPETDGWTVTVVDLASKTERSEHFDAIMVCNGHYHTPKYSEVTGIESFPGLLLHSHDYRVPAPLAGKVVVVLGAGPSGLDLALQISAFAKQVILSHHFKGELLTRFPDNVIQRPDIWSVSGSTVTFQDGSQNQADVLFYCTGYQYSFPFLGAGCGVEVSDNVVQPLYKHLVHIHRPSLCFIGLPFYVCAFTMFDIQVRYFLRLLQGTLVLPSELEMLEHTLAEAATRRDRGLKPGQFHMMGELQGEYYDSLTEEAELPPTPRVLTALHNHSSRLFHQDLINYREKVYRLLDDNTFRQLN